MTITKADQARFDRAASRRAAVPTGFIYDCADWGSPHYIAMTSEKRYRSFGFGNNPIIEVSSFALAERLAASLNAGTLPALHADYRKRAKREFVRSEIRRRDWLRARIARYEFAIARAKWTAYTASSPAVRLAAIQRALHAYRAACGHRKTLDHMQSYAFWEQ